MAVTSFKYLGATLYEDGIALFSRSLYQDCLSCGSSGQTKQDLVVQRHQLRKQVQVLQVSCHLHPPLWLWNMDPAFWLKRKESRLLKLSAWGNFSASPTWSTRPTTGCGARSTSFWVQGTFSGHCQETETCMVRACHMPQEASSNHPSRHLGGWVMPWLAEEMLDGHHQTQRVDIPAYAELLTMAFGREDWNRISAEWSLMSPRRPNRSRDWTELHSSIT